MFVSHTHGRFHYHTFPCLPYTEEKKVTLLDKANVVLVKLVYGERQLQKSLAHANVEPILHVCG
jgi:hypothetical protein